MHLNDQLALPAYLARRKHLEETMLTKKQNDTIGTLSVFAFNHGEMAFHHMCAAALNGEAWAIERIEFASSRIALACADTGKLTDDEFDGLRLSIIRTTDTTRPDGGVARSIEI